MTPPAHPDALRALVEQWRAKAAVTDTFHATMGIGWKVCADELAAVLDRPAPPVEDFMPALHPTMENAAEMLWLVLANVNQGDWSKQSADWQHYAARWRDYYFDAVRAASRPAPEPAPRVRTTGLELLRHAQAGHTVHVASVIRCSCGDEFVTLPTPPVAEAPHA